MTVWGAAAIEEAAAGGRVHVGARDVVTPLARERAAELGVEIVVGSPAPATSGPGPAPSVSTATPSTTGARSSATSAARSSAGRPTSATSASAPPSGRQATSRTPDIPPSPVPPSTVRMSPPATGNGLYPAGRRSVGHPVSPPSGALYRRGAPMPAYGGAPPGSRVLVVGAGNVGMIAAMRLAEADVFAEVVLADVDEGRAQGVALDLTHAAALAGFATSVRGVGTVEGAGRADYVIITAGRPRQPGMSRSDLISTNAAIVGDVARTVAVTSPDAVVVVVTNPLDEMTQHAWTSSGFPARRVLGMAGVLDTARFQALTALTGVARADRVTAWALGSHGEEMVIPLSRATAGGRPLTDQLPGAVLEAIVDRTRGSGAEVVGLLRTGSAFLAPGLSAARMVLAMAADSGEVLPAAVLAEGQYGIHGVYVGLPARLGRGGVREIVELDLTRAELAALRAAADRIRERLGQLPATVST